MVKELHLPFGSISIHTTECAEGLAAVKQSLVIRVKYLKKKFSWTERKQTKRRLNVDKLAVELHHRMLFILTAIVEDEEGDITC